MKPNTLLIAIAKYGKNHMSGELTEHATDYLEDIEQYLPSGKYCLELFLKKKKQY